MPEAKLKLTFERRPGLTIIHVIGSVDHLRYFELEEAIQTQLDKKQTVLVVNMSELTYICSAGINVMGHAASQFENVKGGRLCYVRPAKPPQWHFFTLIGVDQIFPWAATVDEAIRRVTSPESAQGQASG